MIFGIVIVIMCFAMVILRNYKKTVITEFAEKNDIYRYVYPFVLWIYDYTSNNFKVGISHNTKEKLKSIHEVNYTEYVAKRGSKLVILFLGVCILALVMDISYKNESALKGYAITRPAIGEKEEMYDLIVTEGKDRYYVEATVSPLQLTGEEVIKAFEEGYEELKENMLGENISLEEVKSKLVFASSCHNGIIDVSWNSSDRKIIDNDGNVYNEDLEESTEVVLTVEMSYEDYEAEYEIYVTVFKAELTKKQQFEKELNEALAKSDTSGIYEAEYILPDTIGEKNVSYSEDRKNYGGIIFITGILVVLLMIFLPDTELKDKIERRNTQMLLDYSEIVSKLTLLLTSGMTLRRAWERIVLQYQKSGNKRFAYDEMVITYNKLEAGFSEVSAYEAFANRCRLPEYTKLVSILIQNIKKGNEGLTGKLSIEMSNAFEQRKNMAKKLGEEASTKLLFPMMIMLIIVIMIVIVPVFMSF